MVAVTAAAVTVGGDTINPDPEVIPMSLSSFARHGVLHGAAAGPAFDVLISLGKVEEVCANPFVPFDTAVSLLSHKKKIAATAAVSLLCQPWEPAQATTLLRLESRKSPLCALLQHNVLDEEGLDLLLDGPLDTAVADAVLRFQPVDPARGVRFARHAGVLHRLEQLDADASASADLSALRDELAALDDAQLSRVAGLGPVLHNVLAAHPGLLDLLDDQTVTLADRVRSAFAASVDLTELRWQRNLAGLDGDLPRRQDEVWTLMVLAGNPLTREPVLRELLEDLDRRPVPSDRAADLRRNIVRRLDNEQVLADGVTAATAPREKIPWLLRRALPSSFNVLGRPFELRELLANAELDDRERSLLTSELRDCRHLPGVTAALDAAERRHPGLVASGPPAGNDEHRDGDTPAGDRPAVEATATCEHRRRCTSRAERLAAATTLDRELLGVSHHHHPEYLMGLFGYVASERFGGDRHRWEVLFSLIDEFDGPLNELLDAAAML